MCVVAAKSGWLKVANDVFRVARTMPSTAANDSIVKKPKAGWVALSKCATGSASACLGMFQGTKRSVTELAKTSHSHPMGHAQTFYLPHGGTSTGRPH